jgi:type IV secretion system protein VirB3
MEPLRSDPVFLGLTRPAMALGITFGAFLILTIASIFSFLLTKNFVAPILLFVPGYAICFRLCQRDPQIFRMLGVFQGLKVRFFETSARRDAYWGGKSYAPQQIQLSRSVRPRLKQGPRMQRKSSL